MARSPVLTIILVAALAATAVATASVTGNFIQLSLGQTYSVSTSTSANGPQYFSVSNIESTSKLTVTMRNWINSATVYVLYEANTEPSYGDNDGTANSVLTSDTQYYEFSMDQSGPLSIYVSAGGAYTIEVYTPLLSPAGVAGVSVGGIVLFLLILYAISCKTMKRAVDAPDLIRFNSYACLIVGSAMAILPLVFLVLGLTIPGLTVFTILGVIFMFFCLALTGRRTVELNGNTKMLTFTSYWLLVFPKRTVIPLADIANFIVTRTYTRNGIALILTAVRLSGAQTRLFRVYKVGSRCGQLNEFIRRHTPHVARPDPMASGVAALAGVSAPILAAARPSYQPYAAAPGANPAQQQAAIQAQIAALQQQQAALAARGAPPAGYQAPMMPPPMATAVPYAAAAELPPSAPSADDKTKGPML